MSDEQEKEETTDTEQSEGAEGGEEKEAGTEEGAGNSDAGEGAASDEDTSEESGAGDEDGSEEKREEGGDDGDGEDEELTLNRSESSVLSDAEVNDFVEFAKANKIPKDMAQKLLDRAEQSRAKDAEAWAENTGEKWKAQVEAWDKQTRESFKSPDEAAKAVKHANAFSEKYLSKEFKQLLRATGAHAHPVVVKQLASLGSKMFPKKAVDGKAPLKAKSIEDRFYGTAEKVGNAMESEL